MHPIQTEEQQVARMLAETKFGVRAAHFDRQRKYCWTNIDALVSHGLMGMTIPEAYGGKGATLYEATLVAEELARHCTLTARVFVEANMGAIGAIMAYGSEAQKQLCAPLVLAGDKPAICISEPDAGSAATDMATTARRRGNTYIINGSKHWITGGGISKIHLIFARVLDEKGNPEGIGAFIVLADPQKGNLPEGFAITGHEHTLGLCGMPEARLEFRNLVIDAAMRLETPSGLKAGFADLMATYNAQRIGAGTIAMGVAAGALEEAKRYMHERFQFGRPIAEFQGLQWMIADMDVAVHASRLMLHEAAKSAGGICGNLPDMTLAARAKLFASESALKVVNQALQIFGARGYGAEEKIERMYRDVRMFTIGGGTAEVLRNQIAASALDMRLPQTRDGYGEAATRRPFVEAAE